VVVVQRQPDLFQVVGALILAAACGPFCTREEQAAEQPAGTETGCTYFSCWSIAILPFIEQGNLFSAYQDDPSQLHAWLPPKPTLFPAVCAHLHLPLGYARANKLLLPRHWRPTAR